MSAMLRLWGTPGWAGGSAIVFRPERRFQLLAWLALRPGEWLGREQAAALLWPDHDPASARRNLRKVVLDARSVPGVAGLDASDHALRWTVATDVAQFEAALRDAPELRAGALALRQGMLLEGLDEPVNPAWTEWLQAERARLGSHWQRAAHEHLQALGDPAARGEWAQRLLVLDPLDDAAMAAWIEACIAQGAVAAAHQDGRRFAERLAQELGIEPPLRLRALLDAAAGLSPPDRSQPLPSVRGSPAAPAAAGEPAGLAGAFIGRRTELIELSGLLGRPEVRLVTLLGPGGAGKSRLAAEALPVLAAARGGPALTIEVQDLDDVAGLAARLARRLGMVLDDRRDTAGQLAAALAAPGGLLLLDNTEHLADLPGWLARLLAAAPSLTAIVTSRSRLHLPCEQVLALQGLALPDEDSRDLAVAPAFDAVRLFVTRAAAAQPGFDLARHLPSVIDIVQQCAGWPLAIELAAAWVRLLPPAQIARDLRESIDVLERDPASAGLPARPEHASLRAVLDRSWQLLAPSEREAIAALAVFRGAFTRATAQAVCSVALPLLASLVDKSLLTVADDGRFVLHPLVATLALQRLDEDPARAAVLRERHASHFLRRLADSGAASAGDSRGLDAAIELDEPDLRQAWQQALALRSGDLVAPALPAWAGFFERRGRLREGAALLRPALQWPADDAASDLLQGRARAAVARLWFVAGEALDGVQALAASGLAHARRAGDGRAQGACLSVCAACDSDSGRFDAARAGFEQAMALADAQGETAAAVRCLRNLGSVAARAGDYDTALAHMRQAQTRAREAGLAMAELDALQAQAGPHLERADWSEADRVLRQSLPLAAALGARQLLINGRLMRGCALIELGRSDEARAELALARSDGKALGQAKMVLYADTYLALAAARDGRLDAAEQALRAVATEARETGSTLEAMRALLFHGEVLARRGDRLGAAAAWRAVAAEPALPAGERDSARRWLAGLALSAGEVVTVEAQPPDTARALAALLGGAAAG